MGCGDIPVIDYTLTIHGRYEQHTCEGQVLRRGFLFGTREHFLASTCKSNAYNRDFNCSRFFLWPCSRQLCKMPRHARKANSFESTLLLTPLRSILRPLLSVQTSNTLEDHASAIIALQQTRALSAAVRREKDSFDCSALWGGQTISFLRLLFVASLSRFMCCSPSP